MTFSTGLKAGLFLSMAVVLAGCGGGGSWPFSGGSDPEAQERQRARAAEQTNPAREMRESDRETIWDLFTDQDDPNVTVEVNRYLWRASLEILDFMPIEAADPFSGVIVMGWGQPAGGGRAYRATVYVQDPALDARSLKVALVSRAGPASRDTVRAVEDAILTRARQLRVQDSNL